MKSHILGASTLVLALALSATAHADLSKKVIAEFKGQIIVSFGDRRLYYVNAPGQAISYPIAVPREQSRWEGITSVTQKRVNPSWTPTPTMIAENPRLPRWVPGGHPMNPLGVRALYLGSSTYRIHGTDAPWTIGTRLTRRSPRSSTNRSRAAASPARIPSVSGFTSASRRARGTRSSAWPAT